MANEFDNIKNDIRFYVLAIILWVIFAFLYANEFVCIRYHSCDAGDFVLFWILQTFMLGPSLLGSWIIISMVNASKNNDN